MGWRGICHAERSAAESKYLSGDSSPVHGEPVEPQCGSRWPLEEVRMERIPTGLRTMWLERVMQRLQTTSWGVLTLALMLSVFWLVGNAGQAQACSCLPPGSPSEELEKADAVLAGRVVLLQEIPDKPDAYYYRMMVGLEVSAVWKGPAYELMYVRTSRSDISCGFTFEYGERYLVYAYEHADGYETSLCSRNAGLWAAEADLEELGEGYASESGTMAPLTEDLVGIVGSVVAPVPKVEPLPTATATPVPTATATPTPTPRPKPAPTPTIMPTPIPAAMDRGGVEVWVIILAVATTVLVATGMLAYALTRRR